ncbi:hypothetical protein Rfer_4415 (plasmid) [Rhodoferax ferrireducens T118]|uniref:Uncharacterized protein n=1 Tax=Albidiferax ferrireducens (strain ATCC BAA-621 / DSM 15236 / T118) TaxID=338969 RepID=Q21Q44_ALBFT|nr:hypothetical protein [Rhodoferax ferrireducens]ABD72101.1 hypothetical protein Rfer_4415 [Rhodoferax ferrireducens T118]
MSERNCSVSNPPLQRWTVRYGEGTLLFHCQSVDIFQAIELCKEAHPGEIIISASLNPVASELVFSLKPGDASGAWNPTGTFSVNVNDLRGITDKVYIDTAFSDGRTDDVVTLQVALDRIPGAEDNGKSCLQFVEDEIAVSIRTRGEQYVFSLEAAISVNKPALSNKMRGCNLH